MIEALAEIHEDARAGLYTGFVIGLLRPRRRFTVHCIGEACESPAWSRTICLSIDDELREMVRTRSFEETR
jgi:hypothetical protein